MSMLVESVDIPKLTSSDCAVRVNAACAKLMREGRTVVAVVVGDALVKNAAGRRIRQQRAIVKHVPTAGSNADESTVAIASLHTLSAEIRPTTRPDEESCHDTESAYSNGLAVANWDAADRIDAVLAEAAR